MKDPATGLMQPQAAGCNRAASYQQALGSVGADSALPLLARSPVVLVSWRSEVGFAGQLFVRVVLEP